MGSQSRTQLSDFHFHFEELGGHVRHVNRNLGMVGTRGRERSGMEQKTIYKSPLDVL